MATNYFFPPITALFDIYIAEPLLLECKATDSEISGIVTIDCRTNRPITTLCSFDGEIEHPCEFPSHCISNYIPEVLITYHTFM